MSKKEYSITAEDLTRERLERSLSWKQVAINLDLGRSWNARQAWRDLIGTDPNEVHPETVSRKPRAATFRVAGVKGKAKTLTPLWTQVLIDAMSDEELDAFQSEVIDAITHRDITIDRVLRGVTLPQETLRVQRVERFSFEGKEGQECLVVHLYEHRKTGRGKDAMEIGVARTFRVRDIKVVQ